jgi:hypothetical protein
MTPSTTTVSPRTAALIAGAGYVAIFILAIFANFYVRTGLIQTDDPAATIQNIADSQSLFRLGIVSFLAVFILDVVIAWALYVLFRAVNRDVSLLSAWFRLVYTVMLGVSLVFFFVAAQMVAGGGYLSAVGPDQSAIPVMLLLDAFNYAWLIGLACFGIHLLLMGYLVIVSGAAPKALGILLGIAGAAYVIDTVANALLSNYADHASLFLMIVAIPSIVGELAFTVWLLLRAGKDQAHVDAERGQLVDA